MGQKPGGFRRIRVLVPAFVYMSARVYHEGLYGLLSDGPSDALFLSELWLPLLPW